MIKLNIEIKGLDKLDKKLKKIVKELPQTATQSVEDILKNMQGYAIKLEKGHNQKGILVQMIDNQGNIIKGRLYTDKTEMPYAMMEHFGTGQFAEMAHIGVTKHFIESGFTEWLIPVNKVERPLNYPIINIKGNMFYIAHGAQPNHFMTDAEYQDRQDRPKIIKEDFEKMLKEACK